MLLYRVGELTVSPTLRAVYRPVVTGVDNMPQQGAVIVAANHISASDEMFTPSACRRQLLYFAKAEYFTGSGVRGRITAEVFRGLGQVPVERTDTRAAASVIDIGMELLESGAALGIYPEGTRSPDGRMYRFRTGVARLALRSGVPVVPVGLIGTNRVLPPDSRRWRMGRVEVHFGGPLDFSGRESEERSARSLREVTETIRAAVQELSRQDYVDRYGSSVKAAASRPS